MEQPAWYIKRSIKMFLKKDKNQKIECAVCNEKLSSKDAYVSYLKINGNIELHFLHRKCWHKLQKIANKKER